MPGVLQTPQPGPIRRKIQTYPRLHDHVWNPKPLLRTSSLSAMGNAREVPAGETDSARPAAFGRRERFPVEFVRVPTQTLRRDCKTVLSRSRDHCSHAMLITRPPLLLQRKTDRVSGSGAPSLNRQTAHLQSGRAGGIRTHDLLNPIQAFYQAELRPDDRGPIGSLAASSLASVFCGKGGPPGHSEPRRFSLW
jgi:hypothetical protein